MAPTSNEIATAVVLPNIDEQQQYMKRSAILVFTSHVGTMGAYALQIYRKGSRIKRANKIFVGDAWVSRSLLLLYS
jgi:hypothetical protein